MVMAINGGRKIPGLTIRCTSQVVLVVKEPTCQGRRHETWVRSLCQEDPLEEGMATNSSVLAWRIPWKEESGGLQSIALHRARHN